MKVRIKGNTIVLSQAPSRDVQDAFLVKTPTFEFVLDALKGQKTYELPHELKKKDIVAVYLRVQ